jgi:hypothetical protein
MITPKTIYQPVGKNTLLMIPAGEDIEQSIQRYNANRKPIGENYLNWNPQPPIDLEVEQAEYEVDWRLNSQIANLFFNYDVPCNEIAAGMGISIEYVVDFVEAETRCHDYIRTNFKEDLSDTIKRLK